MFIFRQIRHHRIILYIYNYIYTCILYYNYNDCGDCLFKYLVHLCNQQSPHHGTCSCSMHGIFTNIIPCAFRILDFNITNTKARSVSKFFDPTSSTCTCTCQAYRAKHAYCCSKYRDFLSALDSTGIQGKNSEQGDSSW